MFKFAFKIGLGFGAGFVTGKGVARLVGDFVCRLIIEWDDTSVDGGEKSKGDE